MITLNVNGSNAPIKRQMDKEVARAYTHTHTVEYYMAIKVSLTTCDNMDGTRGYCAKWNKLEKDKCHMISLTRRI